MTAIGDVLLYSFTSSYERFATILCINITSYAVRWNTGAIHTQSKRFMDRNCINLGPKNKISKLERIIYDIN